MKQGDKEWIDNASYTELLRRWRFAKVGDPMFQGDTGDYYSDCMTSARDVCNAAHVKASKEIGW